MMHWFLSCLSCLEGGGDTIIGRLVVGWNRSLVDACWCMFFFAFFGVGETEKRDFGVLGMQIQIVES
jgi:hypothetical protein